MTQKPEEMNSEETVEETELIESNSDYTAENIDVLEGLRSCSKTSCNVHWIHGCTRIASLGLRSG